MSLQRLMSLSAVLLTLSTVAAAYPAPSSATRPQSGSFAGPTVWRSAWRPGWLPGDPVTDDPSLPLPVWAPRASGQAGLFIALDPVTRLPIEPSAEQKRAFTARVQLDALLAPTAPLQVERLPGGGEIIYLNGQFQVYSIARRDAKG